MAADYPADELVILGFPCNQFGGQESGTESQIKTFVTSNWGVKPPFYLFSKIDVNGNNAHPLWTRLKSSASRTLLSSIGGTDIKWNFSKFLISNGQDVKRYEPVTMPDGIRGDIDKAIKAAKEAAKNSDSKVPVEA